MLRFVAPRANFDAYTTEIRCNMRKFTEYVTHLIDTFCEIDRLRAGGVMAVGTGAKDGSRRTMVFTLMAFSAPVRDRRIRREISVGKNGGQPDPGTEVRMDHQKALALPAYARRDGDCLV